MFTLHTLIDTYLPNTAVVSEPKRWRCRSILRFDVRETPQETFVVRKQTGIANQVNDGFHNVMTISLRL